MQVISRLKRRQYPKVWSPDSISSLPLLAVTFGIASLRCRRNGICTFEPLNQLPGSMSPLPHRQAMAYAQLPDTPEDLLGLYFLKTAMSTSTVRQFFSGSHFVLEEGISLPSEVVDSKYGDLFMAAGHYPIIPLPEYYLVRFATTASGAGQ